MGRHSHAPSDQPVHIRTEITRWLTVAVAVVVLLTLVAAVVLRPTGRHRNDARDVLATTLVKATVTSADDVVCDDGSFEDSLCVSAIVNITSGRDKGESIVLEFQTDAGSPVVHAGDRIVLATSDAVDRTDPSKGYTFADFQRDRPLLLLAVLFAIVVLALGRWRGGRALVGLALSLTVVIGFVVPAILDGRTPIAVAIVGASVIMLVAIYLVHGFSPQTSVAVLGTAASLGLTGLLAVIFVGATHLTGLASEEASFIQITAAQVNVEGLVLAGIVIGTLGVLDDVTITQVSAVWELRAALPGAPMRDLYYRAVRIGRDHIASAVNTLFLAYAGASLPLLILFVQSGSSVRDVGTTEVVATEIVRTLVGSIGLVASVPLTTALAAVVVTRRAPR